MSQRQSGRLTRDLIGLAGRAVVAALAIHVALSRLADTARLFACWEGAGLTRTRPARGTGWVTLAVGSSLVLAPV